MAIPKSFHESGQGTNEHSCRQSFVLEVQARWNAAGFLKVVLTFFIYIILIYLWAHHGLHVQLES